MASASDCVRVALPLDIAEVDRARTALTAAMTRAVVAGSRRVILDLTDCDFVDAVGYRMLSDIARTAETSGVALQVVGAPAPVVRVITLLDAVLAGEVRAHVALGAGEGAPEPPLAGVAASRQRRQDAPTSAPASRRDDQVTDLADA